MPMSSTAMRSLRQIRVTVRATDPSALARPIAAVSVSRVNQATRRSFSIAAWARAVPAGLRGRSPGAPCRVGEVQRVDGQVHLAGESAGGPAEARGLRGVLRRCGELRPAVRFGPGQELGAGDEDPPDAGGVRGG